MVHAGVPEIDAAFLKINVPEAGSFARFMPCILMIGPTLLPAANAPLAEKSVTTATAAMRTDCLFIEPPGSY